MLVNINNSRNPILPLEYHIPDSEAHVMPDGKLYIYGSFDDREDVYCSEKYHVVSTSNMEEWTLHDVSFEGKDVPWFNDPNAIKYPGIDWSKPTPFIKRLLESLEGLEDKEKFEKQEKGPKPALLFAPDAIYKNGKYYMYFCMPDDSEGVAISDYPEGPFTNPVQLPCGGIDPAIFIDDDGKAYYYWGQLFSHGVQLNEDMVSFDESKIIDDLVTEEEHFFHEGSSMRKIGDTYYYLYANMERGKPTSLGYSTSKSPLGPFEYRGIIIDNADCDPVSWNNHGSIEKYNGQWYVFYHRCSRGTKEHRRLCIEPISILEDGSIPEVKMTSRGPGEPFEAGEEIFGYQVCSLSGKVFIGIDGKGSEYLTNIYDGDSAVFRYVKSYKGFSKAMLKTEGSGEIKLLLNDEVLGKIQVSGNLFSNLDFVKSYESNLEAELKLEFVRSDDLKVVSITLY